MLKVSFLLVVLVATGCVVNPDDGNGDWQPVESEPDIDASSPLPDAPVKPDASIDARPALPDATTKPDAGIDAAAPAPDAGVSSAVRDCQATCRNYQTPYGCITTTKEGQCEQLCAQATAAVLSSFASCQKTEALVCSAWLDCYPILDPSYAPTADDRLECKETCDLLTKLDCLSAIDSTLCTTRCQAAPRRTQLRGFLDCVDAAWPIGSSINCQLASNCVARLF